MTAGEIGRAAGEQYRLIHAFGIQVVGKLHRDRFVLAASKALEEMMAADPVLARPVPPSFAIDDSGRSAAQAIF